ncbi:MAG: PEP-CTERM sorting domain-containing protein [Rhodocyclaceae bacterium]|nr:PEP-CTERM sorting domain-containing protein [Rhodocyclaceae bacterium]
MKRICRIAAVGAGVWVSSGLAMATPVTTLRSCNTSDVQVTSAQQYSSVSAGATLGSNLLLGPVSSAACAGAFEGNDTPYPKTNLGYENDGLLNGAIQGTPPYADLFPAGAFVTDADKTDLDGDGFADDPGWIMLGKTDFGSSGPGPFAPAAVGGDSTIVLASFFTVSQSSTGQGTWAFTPDPLVALRALDLLGKNSFDQFALVFKSGNAFAIYDFTAAQFGVFDPSADDPQFNFAGTWDTTRTLLNCNVNGQGVEKCNAAGISHVTLWARDPGGSSDVPEPQTLWLAGAALISCALVRAPGRMSPCA